MLARRAPHPVKDLATALQNRRLVCDARGYCGPFLNQDYYEAFPDPLWHGMGECIHCQSTVDVASEERRRQLAVRGLRVVREGSRATVRRAASDR